MTPGVLEQQIHDAQQRLQALWQRVGVPEQHGVLAQALEELSIALNELQATSEELRQHVDELAGSRRELELERQRYQDLFEFAPDCYLMTDAYGVILEANRAAAKLFGVRQDFLIGKPLFIFVPQEARRTLRQLVDRLPEFQDVSRLELQLEPRNRAPFPAALVIARVFDRDGQLVGVRWSIHDVTELKQAQDQALQAARLAAIGEAMVGLTHESRNALQRSQACLEMLALRIKDQPEALPLLEQLHSAQNHLHDLYEGVRDYAAPVKLERQACDLGELLERAWSDLRSLEPRRSATLTQETRGLNLRCDVDADKIEQAFRNILENSLAACSDPVEVRSCWSERQLAGHPVLQVVLGDNGPGLTPEAKEKIFAPFYTTKTRGTGLGMAITRRIVEAHGGQVAVSNEGHLGAEIVVSLPRSEL